MESTCLNQCKALGTKQRFFAQVVTFLLPYDSSCTDIAVRIETACIFAASVASEQRYSEAEVTCQHHDGACEASEAMHTGGCKIPGTPVAEEDES